MATTTSYGTWNNHGDSTSLTVEATLAGYISGGDSEWVERIQTDGSFDNMADAYRSAINAALPSSVSLAGDDFYGPYYAADQDFDGYPTNEDGALDITAIIEDIDLGEIVAEHDPDNTEEFDAEHGYIAAINTADDTVAADHTDVSVAEAEVHTYRVDDDGNETPELVMGMNVVTGPAELDVRTDDEYKLIRAEASADAKLAELGWNRTGDWEIADNALYAPVERA